MRFKFSLRTVFIVTLGAAVLIWSRKGPDLQIHYHSNVTDWRRVVLHGAVIWEEPWGRSIEYQDSDGDGIIDMRIQFQKSHMIMSLDDDRDGIFDRQLIQRLGGYKVYAADSTAIEQPVPSTTKE